MKKYPPRTLSRAATWILSVILCGLSLLAVLAMQQGSILFTAYCFLRAPLLILLNLFPIAVLFALLFFLCRNIFYSAAGTTLVWGLLSYVNLLKVTARGDPFVPGDILLLSEGMEAIGSYELRLYPLKLTLLLLFCLALVICGIFFKSYRPKRLTRTLGALTVVLLFAVSMPLAYMNKSLYENMPGPDRANVPSVFEGFGFPYAFLHNFNLYPVDKPQGFSMTEAEGYEKTYLQNKTAPETPPNIIMIMCEAFTDLPNEEAFTYGEKDNPIAAYNRLAAMDSTISGHMIVSNTGAGTANTEFDVLTGMMTNRIGEGTTSAFRVIHRNTASLPRMLSQAGYSTFFMHPGQSWFYNRNSVYNYLGITDQVFSEAFTEEDRKGAWISDESFLRVLEESLEQRQESTPMFTYGVTIQNHQAYGKSKYGFVPPAVSTELSLSETASEYLSVYFEGLKDSANMLEALTEYLDTKTEPYLLVFFGDHQPNLGADYLCYRELGLYPENLDSAENRMELYTVPFLIWGNAAYLQENDLGAQAEALSLGTDPIISSHYLGALTCELAGFSGWDGYFDYLNQLRAQLPVSSVYGYRTAEGAWLEELPEALQKLEDIRLNWQYYRLKYQTVPTGE